jgi:hypothetical protein
MVGRKAGGGGEDGDSQEAPVTVTEQGQIPTSEKDEH